MVGHSVGSRFVLVKFAYVDESGMGDEPYLVTAAVVADGQRMRLTKESWSALFERL